jgi:hemoglobin
VGDWDEHLATMCDFWSGVVLTTGRYKGRPMHKHVPLSLEPEHFKRWLELFEAAAERICPPEAASFFIGRARRIAESLQLGIAHASGALRQQLQSATSRGETGHAA